MKYAMENTTMKISPLETFALGCNYWASHAGIFMWSQWQPEIIEEDFRLLSQSGLKVLRVFPLWPVFQPITQLYGFQGERKEIRWGEKRCSNDEAGQAGVSKEAMEKFKTFADLAKKYNLDLIVGLITGWMSGRFFAPPALEGRNVLTDPMAIMWEVRFVQYFVRHFKNHPAILAWDLGNECNCMGKISSREEAWCWTASITNAIRSEDISHPVISGMHSLSADMKSHWTIRDQAELTDMLTTHPYPLFTPHCDLDPLDAMRSCLHATAESVYYADIAGKPCMVEEIGTLGPMIASEEVAARYMRTNLFSLWAHDCQGALWWCGFDQLHLEKPPYDWESVERELGLFRNDRSLKPVMEEYRAFADLLHKLPKLPPRQREAICLLTENQDSWAAAYTTFILAKQAGFDIQFQYADQPLKEADFYMLPSVKSSSAVPRHVWVELMKRVRNGATLYVSHDNCLLCPFTDIFGLEVQTRERRSEPANVHFDYMNEKISFSISSPYKLNLESTTARILGCEDDGNIAFTCNQYGDGRVYFLTVPLESAIAEIPNAVNDLSASPFWKLYRKMASSLIAGRVVACDDPRIGLTEHHGLDGRCVVVAINYSPEEIKADLKFNEKWELKDHWYGSELLKENNTYQVCISANNAVVLGFSDSSRIEKNNINRLVIPSVRNKTPKEVVQ
jgi:hypothetical protein